jgi:hypothetical protein
VDDPQSLDNTANLLTIPAKHVHSLVWTSGKLVDWVGGSVEYELDGTNSGPRISYPYRFDAALVSPSGRFIAVYERLGTKAILLGPGDSLRELNRSYYHAHVYEYPILLFRLMDGREALAHCPNDYCHLQIEDPVTGEPLSDPNTGMAPSTFHSRLTCNAQGNRIVSACWVWHPFDTVCAYDLNPRGDGSYSLEPCDDVFTRSAEISSAAFNSDGQLVVTSAKEAEGFLDDEPGERLRPGMIGVYDFNKRSFLSLAGLQEEAGTLMPVGREHAVGFFDHPKLIEISTGRVVYRWPELKTGQQASSIMWHKPLPSPSTRSRDVLRWLARSKLRSSPYQRN